MGKVTSLNLGFDMELWNGKVSVIYDWYKKRTDDLLFKDIDIPSSSGFATLTYKNVGRMDNDGWELTVNFNKVVEKGKFSLDINTNFASNKNMIRSLDPSVLNNFNNHSDFGNGGLLYAVCRKAIAWLHLWVPLQGVYSQLRPLRPSGGRRKDGACGP